MQRFYNSSSPIADGQNLIFAGQGTGIWAIKILKQGDGFTTSKVWHNPDLNPSYNTPVLKESSLYGLTQAGKLFCISAQNGQTAWADTLMNKSFGSILDAGSVILALPSSANLVVYKPDKSAYAEVARFKVSDTPVYAHPLLVGNRIYVKDNETLVMWTVQ